ncbi:MAG: hypothetical protein IE916_09985 [Epsilonproteobacteria bacterium]|nr:hypothetical protein [Campylobacterota bacterium]
MKKFNLFKEIIVVSKKELLGAMNSAKRFGINISGKIVYEPFDSKEIIIFAGIHMPKPLSPLMPQKAPSFEDVLGKNYQIVEDDDRVLIKAFSNWQEIIKLNIERASYDDTTGDGVSEFTESDLEDIGWHATEFDINYRTLVEIIEESCDGTLLCIEQQEPYQFSGLGFIADDSHAKEVIFAYCQNEIKRKITEESHFHPDKFDDDTQEAAEFFEVL